MKVLWGIIKFYLFTKEGRDFLWENHKRLMQREAEERKKKLLEKQRKERGEEEEETHLQDRG